MAEAPASGNAGDGMVALPAAAAFLSDRVRVLRWGIVAAGEPRNLSRQSSPPFYRLRAGAHQPRLGLGPRSGREVKGPVGRWANWWRSIPTFSPLISSYTFTFISFTPFIFHHRLMHRTVSSSQSVADRFNSYNTCLCSEIYTLTLGPFIVRKI